MLINYEWFLKESKAFSNVTLQISKYIEEFLEGKDVAYIYPKKFTVSNSVDEWSIFMFTGSGFYLFQPIEEGHRLKEMSMSYYKLDDITSVTLSTTRDLRIAKLELNLSSTEQVEFSSLEDSNADWTDEYAKVIIQLAKYLTK